MADYKISLADAIERLRELHAESITCRHCGRIGKHTCSGRSPGGYEAGAAKLRAGLEGGEVEIETNKVRYRRTPSMRQETCQSDVLNQAT